jgi:hypothetical protein
MDDDEYHQEEEDPFGFNNDAVAQLGGSSSSAGHASSSADPIPIPPPMHNSTPTDSISADEPAAKRVCVVGSITAVEPVITEPIFKKPRTETASSRGGLVNVESRVVETPAACAGASIDPWEALQERKRRKKNNDEQPTTESEFARLARLAASE